MASLDVSDIPLCDEFSDRFDVLRRPETLDHHGRSATSQVVASARGTIYPTGDNSLVRMADFEAGRKTLTIVTTYRLQQASPGHQPDLILYRGTEYVISRVEDYSQYGAGFIVAEASSILATPSPPQ
jgi:hypothetical protein